MTRMKLIEKDLTSLNIELTVDSDLIEKTMNALEKLAADRKDWEWIVKDIIAKNS